MGLGGLCPRGGIVRPVNTQLKGLPVRKRSDRGLLPVQKRSGKKQRQDKEGGVSGDTSLFLYLFLE